jgi:hypothetical protein
MHEGAAGHEAPNFCLPHPQASPAQSWAIPPPLPACDASAQPAGQAAPGAAAGGGAPAQRRHKRAAINHPPPTVRRDRWSTAFIGQAKTPAAGPLQRARRLPPIPRPPVVGEASHHPPTIKQRQPPAVPARAAASGPSGPASLPAPSHAGGAVQLDTITTGERGRRAAAEAPGCPLPLQPVPVGTHAFAMPGDAKSGRLLPSGCA